MQQQVGNRVVLLEIYQLLYDHYGPQHWWPGDSPFEVVLGAILTQAAAWTNVEKALANLKESGLFFLGGPFGIFPKSIWQACCGLQVISTPKHIR